MSFVCIDLGASGSRYMGESAQISVLPNNMVELDAKETSLINPDANDIESCLEVKIEKISGEKCEHFPANVLIGDMAEKSNGIQIRPSMLERKFAQRINYISLITVAAITKLKYGIEDDLDVYMTVPPLEINKAREVFGKLLPGKYKVKLPKYMDGTEVDVTIASVKVYEESFMALTSWFFDLNGQPRPEAVPYLNGTVMSEDIGASTSDVAIVENGRYLNKSGRTYTTGGNEALDYLIERVEEKYAISLNFADAETTMKEGRLKQGNTYIDISDDVAEAKKRLASKLNTYMPGYFRQINKDISTVNAVVVSGGGSMQSQYINEKNEVIKSSEPISAFISNEIHRLSPGTVVIPYGDDARFANVKGLFIRANLDKLNSAA